MTINEREEHIEELFMECQGVLRAKGQAYSGNAEANSNLERSAKDADLSKYQILHVFLNKHLACIRNAIRENPHAPVDDTEGLRGRIIDTINYLAILSSMLKEDELRAMKEPFKATFKA